MTAAAGPVLAWGGHRLVLLPGKAVWLPERRWLLVADVHLGKAASFRRLGVPVPSGTTAGTLDRLGALLQACEAQALVVLGDFLHSAVAQSAGIQAQLHRWRERHAAVAMWLVRGNHDSRAGDPHPSLDIAVVDEPWVLTPVEGKAPGPSLALCHHPQAVVGCDVLAGHDHPCIHLGGRARDRLRLPCFHFAAGVGTVPAFGSFTGMHPVIRHPGDRVYGVTSDAVVPIGPVDGEPLHCPPWPPSNT